MAVICQREAFIPDGIRPPPAMQRVFIGIPVDKQSQRRINQLLKPFERPDKGISWVAEINRHMTLAFLGNIPVTDIINLARLLDKTYQQAPCFIFKLAKLRRFPGPAGRIIALTGEPDGRLDDIFSLTQELLQEHGFEYDRKDFRPHITVARVRNEKHLETTYEQAVNINLKVNKITLYRSKLTESGRFYMSLKETLLGR